MLEDSSYLEQVCVPLRSLNQSCEYDKQCSSAEGHENMVCKKTVTEQGLTTSVSVCTCAESYKWNFCFASMARCIPIHQMANDNSQKENQNHYQDQCPQLDTVSAKSEEVFQDLIRNKENAIGMIYVWWIFPPLSILDQERDSNQNQIRSSHALFYYGSRMYSLGHVTYLIIMMLGIIVPLVIIGITLISLYCYRQISYNRQYQTRRASDFSSNFYPDNNVHFTPYEKKKSITHFGLTPVMNITTTITSPNNSNGFFKPNKSNKESVEDKLDLVQNEHLEQVHRFV